MFFCGPETANPNLCESQTCLHPHNMPERMAVSPLQLPVNLRIVLVGVDLQHMGRTIEGGEDGISDRMVAAQNDPDGNVPASRMVRTRCVMSSKVRPALAGRISTSLTSTIRPRVSSSVRYVSSLSEIVEVMRRETQSVFTN